MTSMSSMARDNRLIWAIRLDRMVTMERLTWRSRLSRLCRHRILPSQESYPLLGSMTGMTRKDGATRMVSLAKFHRLIRG